MRLLIFILILISTLSSSQSLQPTLGGRYTGGLSYNFEHEYFSGQVGLLYKLKNMKTSAMLSGEYTYDYAKEYDRRDENFYIIRLQGSQKVSDLVAFTGYVGYFDGFKVNMRNNFAWGTGIQLINEDLIAELLYENISSYPHVSIGVNFPLWGFKKMKIQ